MYKLNKKTIVSCSPKSYLRIYLLCSHEHQSGVDLLQADKAAVADIVQERDGLHILLDP